MAQVQDVDKKIIKDLIDRRHNKEALLEYVNDASLTVLGWLSDNYGAEFDLGGGKIIDYEIPVMNNQRLSDDQLYDLMTRFDLSFSLSEEGVVL